MIDIYNKLLCKISKEHICVNEPMSKHTTFKIGGLADAFVKVHSVEELRNVLDIAKEDNIPVTIIGNGSNVLVKDRWN